MGPKLQRPFCGVFAQWAIQKNILTAFRARYTIMHISVGQTTWCSQRFLRFVQAHLFCQPLIWSLRHSCNIHYISSYMSTYPSKLQSLNPNQVVFRHKPDRIIKHIVVERWYWKLKPGNEKLHSHILACLFFLSENILPTFILYIFPRCGHRWIKTNTCIHTHTQRQRWQKDSH